MIPITVSATMPSVNADSSVCTDLSRWRTYAVLCGSPDSDSLLVADVDVTGHEGDSLSFAWTPPRTGFTARLWCFTTDKTGNVSARSNYWTLAVPYEEASGDTSALASWNFDEQSGPALDGSGHGNDASLRNGAYRLAGALVPAGGYAWVGANAGLDGVASKLAISAHIRRRALSDVGLIVHKGVPGSGGYLLGVGVPPCGVNQVKFSKYGVLDICFGSFPADTLWHTILAAGDSTGSTLYIDGQQNAVNSDGRAWKPSSANLGIGGADNRTNFWAGDVDDVSVYNWRIAP